MLSMRSDGPILNLRLFSSVNIASVSEPQAPATPAVPDYVGVPSTRTVSMTDPPELIRARPQPTVEIQGLLRKRLWVFSLITAAFYTVLLPGALKSLFESDATLAVRFYQVFKCCVLVTALGLSYMLHRRAALTFSQLRMTELVLFGMVLLQFAWVDYRTLFVRKLPAVLAAGADERLALLVVAAQVMMWFILIVGYGVLIPNTWKRSALVLAFIAMIPVGLSAAAGFAGDGIIPRHLVSHYLVALCTWLGMAVAIAVYGSHRIESLRIEASTARRLGHYQLKERLGAGGMGEVYLAEHAFLRRPCAVKLIRPERAHDTASLARFEREVQTTSTLTHPNTVQIYDYGNTEDGTFYYVMEFLPGLTLQQLVERDGPLAPDRAVRIVQQVCGALREAHGVGLIHCDVKPGNIIIGQRGGENEVAKLLDFGLVRMLASTTRDERFTQEGVIKGTPAFMSPEQAVGDDLDARSDIYSLGAAAFFALTGQAPFVRGSSAQVRLAQITEPAVFHEPGRFAVPQDLQAVVLRCLEKDPSHRFQTADSLGRALAGCYDAILGGPPIALLPTDL